MVARAKPLLQGKTSGVSSWQSPGCRRRVRPRARPAPLIASQHQELSIDDEQLGDRIFESTAGFHGWADSIDPVAGDGLDMFLPVGHKR
jgi:hypothetical protein